jgi:hypothetical protein
MLHWTASLFLQPIGTFRGADRPVPDELLIGVCLFLVFIYAIVALFLFYGSEDR